MILVDASIWIDHIRSPDASLQPLLDANEVACHPFIIGEVALGHIRPRDAVLAGLKILPSAIIAADGEVVQLIDRYQLTGSGLGYVDAHLLASSLLTVDCLLWTRDKKLKEFASRLGTAAKGLN
ncbi:MAG: PIN domain-containing protein [Rhizomicrobium sp.]